MYIPDYELESNEQVAYTARVPPKMKDEIDRRCKQSGLSQAQWTRKALLFALQHMDENDLPENRIKQIDDMSEEIKKMRVEIDYLTKFIEASK